MNKETPWTMEPWHIRVACRQANIMLGSNDCVQFPRKIEGPNLDWEAKEFYVIIKVSQSLIIVGNFALFQKLISKSSVILVYFHNTCL